MDECKLANPDSKTNTSVSVVGSELIITVVSNDLTLGNHVQLYLNTDNQAETGFQFDGEAWANSGVDFIIEDGDLFKSTSNNIEWNWNTDIGDISYVAGYDKIEIGIPLAFMGNFAIALKLVL